MALGVLQPSTGLEERLPAAPVPALFKASKEVTDKQPRTPARNGVSPHNMVFTHTNADSPFAPAVPV